MYRCNEDVIAKNHFHLYPYRPKIINQREMYSMRV